MTIGIKDKKLMPNRNLGLGLGGILIVIGMLFLLLANHVLISGILSGKDSLFSYSIYFRN
jgi:hypothetical protein